jgi:hypothetical protein
MQNRGDALFGCAQTRAATALILFVSDAQRRTPHVDVQTQKSP